LHGSTLTIPLHYRSTICRLQLFCLLDDFNIDIALIQTKCCVYVYIIETFSVSLVRYMTSS